MQHRKWQLAFSSIYFWCSSQKAHKHFKYCFSLLWSSINTKTASSQFCLCKALLIARNNVMIKVYSCMITSFFILLFFFLLLLHLCCCPSSGHQKAQRMTDKVHASWGQLCPMSTKVWVSPCCKHAHRKIPRRLQLTPSSLHSESKPVQTKTS